MISVDCAFFPSAAECAVAERIREKKTLKRVFYDIVEEQKKKLLHRVSFSLSKVKCWVKEEEEEEKEEKK